MFDELKNMMALFYLPVKAAIFNSTFISLEYLTNSLITRLSCTTVLNKIRNGEKGERVDANRYAADEISIGCRLVGSELGG
jgi:hypothetical protein